MCHNKVAIIAVGVAIILAVVLGIIAGILLPSVFTSVGRFLLAEMVTCTIALIILAAYLLDDNGFKAKKPEGFKIYLSTILYSGVFGFIFSVLGLTTTAISSTLGTVFFCVCAGLYALLLMGIVFTVKYMIDQSRSGEQSPPRRFLRILHLRAYR